MRIFAVLVTVLAAVSVRAEPIKRMQHTAVSPDGATIAFSYHEDLWTVPSEGGTATRLTIHRARDIAPVFSPDGKTIAFASPRFGNYDIYTIPVEGGVPTRLTTDSSSDIPCRYTADGEWIVYYSSRLGSTDLWKVRVTGGAAIRLTSSGFESEYWGAPSPDGKQIAFCSGGGRGEWQRPGYRSSSNPDIYVADMAMPLTKWTRLTDHLGVDYWPMWSEDGKWIYYVTDGGSETLNIWRMRPDGGEKQQVTHHKGDRVRYADISRVGDRIVYIYDSEIWICSARTGETHRVPVEIADDDRVNPDTYVTYTSDCTEFSLSPDGKLVAFVVRGEIFVTGAEKGGPTRRITNSPWREYEVQWFPNSAGLVYVSDRTGSRDLFTCDLMGNEKQLTNDPADELFPTFSPDGEWIAFHYGDRDIRAIKPDGSGMKTIARGAFPEIGKWSTSRFRWSPDGKWIIYGSTEASYHSNVYVQQIGGGSPVRITNGAGSALDAWWSPEMDYMVYQSSHFDNDDIWITRSQEPALKFDEDELDKVILPPPPPEKKDEKPARKPFDFAKVEERGERLTTNEEDDSSPVPTPDGKTIVFVSRRDGNQIWTVGIDEPGKEKKLTSEGGNKSCVQVAPDGKRVYYLDGDRIKWIAMDGKTSGDVAFTAEMTIDFHTENLQVFDEAWWILDRYYYDLEHQGHDWKAIRDKYRPLLRYCATKSEVADVLNEMIGEINSSHMGAGAAPSGGGGPNENTGCLGVVFDYDLLEREGVYKIVEVVPKMPADNVYSKLLPGDHILAIDGAAPDDRNPIDTLLNGKVGRKVVLKVASLRPDGPTREVAIKPVDGGALGECIYQAWIARNREMVHTLSGGRVGYCHIRGMDGPSLDKLKRDLVTEAIGKEALILDVRFNGGGSTAHEVLGILEKKPFLIRQIGDFEKQSETLFRGIGFEGRKALLINQHSFSNAEIMAEGFKRLKLGPVIGVTTAGGCIGTGGWTMIDGSNIRTPVIGAYTLDGKNMEGYGVKPDVYVPVTEADWAAGRDPQIEKAVKALRMKDEG